MVDTQGVEKWRNDKSFSVLVILAFSDEVVESLISRILLVRVAKPSGLGWQAIKACLRVTQGTISKVVVNGYHPFS